MRTICSAVALLLLIFPGSIMAAEPPIYIEAEDADEFEEPMGVSDDDAKAWGKYIQVPGEGLKKVKQPLAMYEIEVPRDATLYIWGRARANDTLDNSFFFKLNNDAGITDLVWDIPSENPGAGGFCPNWCWDLIAERRPQNEEPYEFDFKQGRNELYIVYREAFTGLDALYIVPDPNMMPPDAPPGGLVPEPKQAVDPNSKLAAMWGEIKRKAITQ